MQSLLIYIIYPCVFNMRDMCLYVSIFLHDCKGKPYFPTHLRPDFAPTVESEGLKPKSKLKGGSLQFQATNLSYLRELGSSFSWREILVGCKN